MKFTSITFLILLFTNLAQVMATEPTADGDPTNPFGSGKVTAGDGGTRPFCNPSLFPIFSIDMKNLNGSDISQMNFPCDLYVKITNDEGISDYVNLMPGDFSEVVYTINSGPSMTPGPTGPVEVNTGRYRAYVQSANPITHHNECVGDARRYTFELELVCANFDEENGNYFYTPIQYCGENSGWDQFLNGILPSAPDCLVEDAGRVRGYTTYELCCDVEVGSMNIDMDIGHSPLVKADQSLDFKVLPSFQATELVVVSDEQSKFDVIMTDIAGNVVTRKQITNASNYTLAHDGLKAGLYFVSIASEGQIRTKKIIVQ